MVMSPTEGGGQFRPSGDPGGTLVAAKVSAVGADPLGS